MKKIKRLLCLVITGVMCIGTASISVNAAEKWPEGVSVDSENAIVMEASTGTILYQKDCKKKSYPASITKIMTTMLALQNSSPDEIVTFSQDAIYKTEGSGVARDIGEQLTMKDCLYAVMLESANECAYAVAEHIGGGDYSKFVDLMNEKAKELGCENTHFNNCNGLPDEQHYTTCYDMALIAREAIKNDDFRTLISTKTYTLPKTNKKDQELTMYNHHAMICSNRTSRYLYEYAIGGKTGYTVAARNTLVTYAEKDGMLLICVVMRSNSSAQYADTEKLFDYCFNNFKMYNVAQNEKRYSNNSQTDSLKLSQTQPFAELDSDAEIILPKAASFDDTSVDVSYDNVNDTVLGTLVYKYGNRVAGKADVVTTGASVEPFEFSKGSLLSTAADTDGEDSADSSKEINKSTLRNIIVIIVVAAAVLFAVLWLFANKNRIFRGKSGSGKKYKKIRKNRKW
ncbi:D-alanyl-D-alanine carboxypeptidase dacB precursor [uncultured Roseburia sp.]|uniref:D-alanyl-D-alanine carboxypeptidase n=1 Tax=Brotonthovivens ammoniilytica TaxID=2981725 RepID=A0ABT2THL9_9FIRM|nr:D-alanyl-D-alanine carboxypeptidase family protein [Brotonthovivens ammoniilytica]MCU6761692.1 D-alanyl-D-alanine carboxypeptidase [Brotonthovivens ammoniilytica]SCI43686.1 D-alanyl-D-alanine carboxypeptidase dacB precursor [uncultured Roseburia sp.]